MLRSRGLPRVLHSTDFMMSLSKMSALFLTEELPGRIEEPTEKRSRYVGHVDLNSEAVQSLLKAKSSHVGVLAEVNVLWIVQCHGFSHNLICFCYIISKTQME